MKNIASNIVDFINKLRIGKMIRIVMKNKWVLLSLVFLILFYYFFYSIKEGVTGSTETETETAPENETETAPENDVPMSQITEGAFDTSINSKITSTSKSITKAEGDAELIKEDINTSIENIQNTLTQIVTRNYEINKKFPEP